MSNTRGTVEIYEGNNTIRKLMSDALMRAGFSVVERTAGSPTPAEGCDLLVVDVDSGLPDTDARARVYQEDERPVLYCGVRSSRERFPSNPWLDRPFSKNTFLSECLILVEGPTAERITIAGDDDPITRELHYDEAISLEKQLGLEPGVLRTDHGYEAEAEADEDDVMDLDAHGSAIIEVADLRSLMTGGRLVGSVATRRVDANELIHDRSELPRLMPRTPSFNQTMPDTPLAMASLADGQDLSNTTESGIVPPPDETDASRLSADLKNVARILADSWNRIGVTARTEDRADRIERILSSLFEGGMRAVSQEIRRIPSGVGFAGSLESLPVIDLLRTIRDRKLRGRLEISVPDATWVLFLESGTIDDLENLSGSADLQLLDALLAMQQLSPTHHVEMSKGYATGEFHEPAAFKLVQDQVVALEDVQRARVRCLKDAFRVICAARRGNFAFLEILNGDGQSWPVRGLGQSVDTLLLEVLRESSFDTGDSQATARTVLMLDAGRTASLAPEALTEEERAVLIFFRDGEKVGSIVEQLSHPELERIVNRLKKLELLKRTSPKIVTPRVVSPPIEVRSQTVVNPLTDVLSRNERRKNSTDGDDQPTHLKNSIHIGPDLDDDDESNTDTDNHLDDDTPA